MGREERVSRDANVAAVAEYERTIGPTLCFGERRECPKCGVPRDHFQMLYCGGINPNDPASVRKNWTERGGCPTEGEHLHVICPRCKYGWHEFCADNDRNREPRIIT